ncbi:hypothetical protein [Paraburkholderia flava]|uniref:hypothetical protein n=1 Tax=Paraburkholderia flava TaxID=2547393 RepID=UPI00106190D9|nr:hypothetical protein [Paraburkholderia flava]
MTDSADPAASPTTRSRRAGATQAQPSPVSTDTENKLARAARSAQRLAQLSDVPADDSTLDLFPDDPTRATLQAMNIDVRQGTLSGFELPDVVRVAVGVSDHATPGVDTKTARRATRPARTEDEVSSSVSGAVHDMWNHEPAAQTASAEAGVETASVDDAAREKTAEGEADGATPSSMAAASVVRSVAALRQLGEGSSAESEAPAPAPVSASRTTPPPPQRFAATFAKAASASREAEEASAGSRDGTPAASETPPIQTTFRPPAPTVSHETTRDTPELDRARATAFADTVDALYGVIADQRRGALDHSRRMKWMLSIVVAALLVTVVVGIAQTMLLMRLARNTAFQQQRIEQMMLNQQATLATLLDTDSATVSAPAVTPPAPAAAAPAPSHPATATRHPAKKTAHSHKPKPTNAH